LPIATGFKRKIVARASHKLTARTVTAAKVPGIYADGEGLFLQVTVGRDGSSRRSWLLRYTAPSGRRREMGLGRADMVELGQAREVARTHRKTAAAGVDPLEARAAEKAGLAAKAAHSTTFKECAEAYIAAHEAGWRNDKHRAQWRSTLKDYAYPIIGAVPVADVDQAMVMKVLDPIWPTKTETASRLRGRIEKVLDWAKARGHRSGDNPALRRWRGLLAVSDPDGRAVLRSGPDDLGRSRP
jgi:hypothetical protein